jgi:hypothetical protein
MGMRYGLMFTLLAALSAPCMAADTLYVQVPAVLAKDAPMISAVKEQCTLPQIVGDDVFHSVSEVYDDSKKVDSEAAVIGAPVLKSTILSAHGWAGGGWSGSKEITLQVELIKDGKVLDATTVDYSSRGGMFGMFKGTCDILHFAAGKLGKRVAKWVGKHHGDFGVKVGDE